MSETDTREDVLLRPEPTFAPYSVYVDVSPTYTEWDKYIPRDVYVSDTFRVWELIADSHNLATAKHYRRVNAEHKSGEVKIYHNNLESFISDHPVFGK